MWISLLSTPVKKQAPVSGQLKYPETVFHVLLLKVILCSHYSLFFLFFFKFHFNLGIIPLLQISLKMWGWLLLQDSKLKARVSHVIIYMIKLCVSHWLKQVHFSGNTSADYK